MEDDPDEALAMLADLTGSDRPETARARTPIGRPTASRPEPAGTGTTAGFGTSPSATGPMARHRSRRQPRADRRGCGGSAGSTPNGSGSERGSSPAPRCACWSTGAARWAANPWRPRPSPRPRWHGVARRLLRARFGKDVVVAKSQDHRSQTKRSSMLCSPSRVRDDRHRRSPAVGSRPTVSLHRSPQDRRAAVRLSGHGGRRCRGRSSRDRRARDRCSRERQ